MMSYQSTHSYLNRDYIFFIQILNNFALQPVLRLLWEMGINSHHYIIIIAEPVVISIPLNRQDVIPSMKNNISQHVYLKCEEHNSKKYILRINVR